MVGTIIAIGSVAITTAVTEKICFAFNRPDMAEWTKVAGMSLSGGLAVSLAISLLNQVKEAFGG